jgi:NhaP-type Na+/H+ and K+/H+ antiporter
VPGSIGFFNIEFSAVLLSAALQGLTLSPLVARLEITTAAER